MSQEEVEGWNRGERETEAGRNNIQVDLREAKVAGDPRPRSFFLMKKKKNAYMCGRAQDYLKFQDLYVKTLRIFKCTYGSGSHKTKKIFIESQNLYSRRLRIISSFSSF